MQLYRNTKVCPKFLRHGTCICAQKHGTEWCVPIMAILASNSIDSTRYRVWKFDVCHKKLWWNCELCHRKFPPLGGLQRNQTTISEFVVGDFVHKDSRRIAFSQGSLRAGIQGHIANKNENGTLGWTANCGERIEGVGASCADFQHSTKICDSTSRVDIQHGYYIDVVMISSLNRVSRLWKTSSLRNYREAHFLGERRKAHLWAMS